MIVRTLSATGDWSFGKGSNDFLTLNAAIAQTLKTRLNTFLGDCIFDSNAGLDWFSFLGEKNQVGLNLAVSSVILNTYGVTGIEQLSITLDRSTRNIDIQYTCTTIYTGVPGATKLIVGNFALLLDETGNFLTSENGELLRA
jgi:hypothetical protein